MTQEQKLTVAMIAEEFDRKHSTVYSWFARGLKSVDPAGSKKVTTRAELLAFLKRIGKHKDKL